MAHLLETMAYLHAPPRHSLGNQLGAGQPIEVRAQQAGMDWRICDRRLNRDTGIAMQLTLNSAFHHRPPVTTISLLQRRS